MKRRILASLLTLVMMLSLLPTAALANGETNDSPSPSQPSTKYDWNDYGGYYDSATEGENRYVTNPKEIEDLYTEIYKAAGEVAKINVIEKAVGDGLIANNLAARLKEVVHVYTAEERSEGVHFQKNANTNLNDFVATVTGDEMLISGEGTLMAYNKYNDVFYAPSNASVALRPWNTERVGKELSSVRFGYGITEVGEYAFYHQSRSDITSATFNRNLKIHLPDSLEKMSQATFMSLNVGNIAIPASVTSLSTRQFGTASAMYVLGDPAIVTTTSSFASSGDTTVYIKKDSALASKSNITNMNLKEVDAIGACGADEHYTSEMVWMVDGDTLTITAMSNGSGVMADYSDSNSAPWKAYADQIKKIVLSSGVKNIGANAFTGLTQVDDVTVPASVEIDKDAANPFGVNIANTSWGYSAGSSFEAWLKNHGYTGDTNRDELGRLKLTKTDNEYFHEYIGDTDIAAKMTKDGVLTIYPTYCANSDTDVPNVNGYHGDNTGFPWFDVFYDDNYTPDLDANGKLNNWSGLGKFQQYLTKIVWADGITNTGAYLFNGAANMPSTQIELQIPDSVKTVGAFILGSAKSDPEVIVPVGTTNIGAAFNGKENIAKNVYILNSEMTGIPVVKRGGNTTTSGGDKTARNICYGFDYTVHVKEGSAAYNKLATGNYTIKTHTDMGACGVAPYSSYVFYLYDADTKTLTIKGSGAMADYASASEAPWSGYDVGKIDVEDGVTHIGAYAFAGFVKLRQDSANVTLPKGIDVADTAFAKSDDQGRDPLPLTPDLYYNAYIGNTTIDNTTIAAKMSKDGVITIYPTDTSKHTVVPGINGYQGDNTAFPWYEAYGKEFTKDFTGVHASEIKEIVFANGLTEIGGYLFNDVRGMPTSVKVRIPDSVTKVGGALVGTKNRGASIATGEQMTDVGFWYAGSASSVYILNENMTGIPVPPENLPTRTIANATGAEVAMHVKAGSTAYTTLTTKQGTTYTNIITHTNLGACGVAPYSSEVFWTYDADSKTLTVLGDGAIKDYASASYAPWHDFDVETLLVQSGVTKIGNNAFASLTSLKTVHVADSVAEVANTAFATANNQIVESLKNTTFLTGSDAMNTWLENHGAKVLPSFGVVDNYKWSISGDVLTIEVKDAASTDELGEKSAVISSITDASVPAWVAYKSMITTVKIGYGVTEIGDKVFADMPVLTSVKLPSSLTKIGAEAFVNTPKLTKIYLPKKTIDVAATAFGTSSSAAKNLTIQISPVAPVSQKNIKSQGNTTITVDDTKNLNVLLIGNSYFGALSGYMKNIAQGLGKSDAMIANYYFGGDSGNLAAYVQRINNKTIGTYNPEKDVFSGYKENGVRNDSYNSNPLSMGIEAEDWDYVVMETWGKNEPAGANGDGFKLSQDPNLTTLKNYINKYAPQAEVSLYHVYSCRYLAENVTPVETLTKQWQRYVDGADDGLSDIVKHVIPASTLIQNARLTYLNANGSELQRNPPSDITHLTGEGDFINAIMMYEMLTGKSTEAFNHGSFADHKEAFYHKLVDVTKAAGMKKLTYAYVEHDGATAYYDSLADAVAAAVNGDKLTILGMPKNDTELAIAAGVTVEIFGSSEDHTIVLTNGGKITQTGLLAFCGNQVDSEAATTTQYLTANPETGVLVRSDHTHTYGTPIYIWSEDGKSCTAEMNCTANVCTYKVTENAAITSSEKKPATCTTKGTKTYTATFSAANGFVTQTKDVDIAATGHDWSNHDGICKVCKTPCGETHQPGTTCPVCHKYTSYPYVPGAPTYPATAPAAPNGTVTVSPANASKGANVTVTVKPNEGYELGSLTVKDASGDLLPLADLGNGKFGFVMPASKVSVEANFVKSAVSTGFADVPANAFFADAVKWAVDKGVTNGLTETMFGPYEPCTRGQIITCLWRAAGSPEPKTAVSFADVPAGSYYAKAVAWAIENGITNGMTETTFAPDATCTRGQGVTFLYRALKGSAGATSSFVDVPANAFYADAVGWAVSGKVTDGTSNTTFSPDDNCTRGQIVTFLFRAYSK